MPKAGEVKAVNINQEKKKAPSRISFRERNIFKPPPKLPNIQNARALVQQGYVGIMKYTDQNPSITYLATYGIAPCLGLTLYNAATQYGIMAHIDSEITREKFNNFKKRKNDSNYQKTDDYKHIIHEYEKISRLLSQLIETIKDKKNSSIEVSVVFTQCHDEQKGLGYPLKAIFDETCQKLGIHYVEPFKPDNRNLRKDDENVSIHLPSGKVARYLGENEESINVMNHINGFEYYKISSNGQLIKQEETLQIDSLRK
jgi:hypothetical protein